MKPEHYRESTDPQDAKTDRQRTSSDRWGRALRNGSIAALLLGLAITALLIARLITPKTGRPPEHAWLNYDLQTMPPEYSAFNDNNYATPLIACLLVEGRDMSQLTDRTGILYEAELIERLDLPLSLSEDLARPYQMPEAASGTVFLYQYVDRFGASEPRIYDDETQSLQLVSTHGFLLPGERYLVLVHPSEYVPEFGPYTQDNVFQLGDLLKAQETPLGTMTVFQNGYYGQSVIPVPSSTAQIQEVIEAPEMVLSQLNPYFLPAQATSLPAPDWHAWRYFGTPENYEDYQAFIRTIFDLLREYL